MGEPSTERATETTRVGFLIDRWQPRRGGAEAALAQLAEFLEARGHEVLAFGARGPRPGERAPGRFVPVRARGWTRGARERALGRAMVDAARSAGCRVTVGVRHLPAVDVLWSHGGSHRATLAAIARSRGRAAGAATGRHRTFVALESALFSGGARLVVCPSRLVYDELRALYPDATARLALVPNGVDLSRFHPRNRGTIGAVLRRELAVDDASPLLAFVARNPILKGLPSLLEALTGLAGEPWHLVVAGSDRARRLVRGAELPSDRVTVLDDVDPASIAAAADLAVLPTWRDTSGLVLLEALASGTPVVTTRLAGACEVVVSDDVIESPADTAGLRDRIAGRIAGILRGDVDRDALRRAVADRDHGRWLASLEELLFQVQHLPVEE